MITASSSSASVSGVASGSPGLPSPAGGGATPKRTMTYNQLTSCPDMEPAFVPIYEKARPYTMTSLERMYGLYKAVEHVVRQRIAGDFVECGVWKGGSMVVVAETLKLLGDTRRTLWLYDTFEGMPPSEAVDVQYDGQTAAQRFAATHPADAKTGWCEVGLDEVKAALATTGYLESRLRYVRGLVEETIPREAPAAIALLRLDTDWYASTKHELEHLYPRLTRGGPLILDDYGHWRGCRQAVDEYFATLEAAPYLARLDYTGRVGIKP